LFVHFSGKEEEKKEEFFSSVRPEEIPDVPLPKYLFRGPPVGADGDKNKDE
jgi:hypothetical protein